MQKQITIEQLAGYLPYFLPVKILNHYQDGVGIEYSVITGYYLLNKELHVTYAGGSTGKSNTEFIPRLRPLSSLTKEITHNNEKFVPAHILFKRTDFEIECGMPDEIDKALDFMLGENRNEMCHPLSFWQKLYEYHFDIHGLLDAGLALPIND